MSSPISQDESPVLFGVADGVGTITLNRPGVLNALNNALSDALLAALTTLEGILRRG